MASSSSLRRLAPVLLGLLFLASLASHSTATPVDDALTYIGNLGDKTATAKALMNGLYPLNWNIGSNAQYLSFARPEHVTPVLWTQDGTLIGAIGTDFASGARFGAFSANLQSSSSNSVKQLHAGVISWLLGDASLSASQARSLNVTVSFGTGGYTSNTGLFKTVFPNWTVKACHNTELLAACLAGADLHFVFGSQTLPAVNSSVAKTVFTSRMTTQQTPIIYNHDSGWGGDNAGVSAVLGISPFPYAGIYFAGAAGQTVAITGDADVSSYVVDKFMFGAWKSFLQRIRDDSFTFDLSSCTTDSCAENAAFGTEVWAPIQNMKSTIASFEANGISPLGDAASGLMDLMVKVGDYFRSSISYPLTRATGSRLQWAKYLAADALYVQLRASGVAQPDLGRFNKLLNSTVPRLSSVSKSFTTKFSSGTRSFTYSAAAGDTITITRTDTNAGLVPRVFVNMVRGNTYAVRDGNYKRPMWLYGNGIPIKVGQTITINSAYGGIIFCSVPASEVDSVSQTISFTLTNVVQHPVYIMGTGQSIANFKTAASALVHGWIEFIHPYLEVHERWESVLSTMNSYNNNFDKVITNFEKYLFQYHYALAGFIADGLNTLPTVATRAASFGLRGQNYNGAHHRLGGVQHLNSEAGFAVCGAGCSGNPIDLGWSFGPSGWGEHHELGHNIQYGRFKIDGGASGEVSNNIFPLAVNWKRANTDGDLSGNEGTRTSVAAKVALLQQAAAEGKTAADVGVVGASLDFYTALLTSGRGRWEDDGLLIIPQLYLMSRNIDAVSNWTADKDNFGYSLYASKPSGDNGNDFMVMAFSWLNKLDYRPFFWLWGVSWSAQADAQIDAYGFNLVSTAIPIYASNFTYVNNVTVDNPNNPYIRTPADRASLNNNPTGAGAVLAVSSLAMLISFLASLIFVF